MRWRTPLIHRTNPNSLSTIAFMQPFCTIEKQYAEMIVALAAVCYWGNFVHIIDLAINTAINIIIITNAVV